MWLAAADSTLDFPQLLKELGAGALVLVAFASGLRWSSGRADQREQNLQQKVDGLEAEVKRLQEERIREIGNDRDRERVLATNLGPALSQSAATLNAAMHKLEENRDASSSTSEVEQLREAIRRLTERLDR